jgi:hypothetical protein
VVGYHYLHTAIDDHSRLAYAELLPDELGETAAAFWTRARTWFTAQGITVARVLTDNGSCYRSRTFAASLGAASHKRTRPYRPQTNGKAERFNRTLLEEWAYARPYQSDTERCHAFPVWLHHYNHHRGHTAIGGLPPASRVPNLSGQNSDRKPVLRCDVSPGIPPPRRARGATIRSVTPTFSFRLGRFLRGRRGGLRLALPLVPRPSRRRCRLGTWSSVVGVARLGALRAPVAARLAGRPRVGGRWPLGCLLGYPRNNRAGTSILNVERSEAVDHAGDHTLRGARKAVICGGDAGQAQGHRPSQHGADDHSASAGAASLRSQIRQAIRQQGFELGRRGRHVHLTEVVHFQQDALEPDRLRVWYRQH